MRHKVLHRQLVDRVSVGQRRLAMLADVAVDVLVGETFADESPAVHLERRKKVGRNRQAEIEDFADLKEDGQVGGGALAGQIAGAGIPAAFTFGSSRQNAMRKKERFCFYFFCFIRRNDQ